MYESFYNMHILCAVYTIKKVMVLYNAETSEIEPMALSHDPVFLLYTVYCSV